MSYVPLKGAGCVSAGQPHHVTTCHPRPNTSITKFVSVGSSSDVDPLELFIETEMTFNAAHERLVTYSSKVQGACPQTGFSVTTRYPRKHLRHEPPASVRSSTFMTCGLLLVRVETKTATK